MEQKGTVTLETDRLILRKLKHSDAENMFNNWVSDKEVTKYLTWAPHKYLYDTKELLEAWIGRYNNLRFYQWGIALKDSDEVIGTISSVGMNEKIGLVHIGYCISKDYWNKGITSEALKEIIRFFFEEVKANKVESRHDPKNIFSGKVMEKCGMKYEGTLRQADWNNSGVCDTSYYGILAEEYKNM